MKASTSYLDSDTPTRLPIFSVYLGGFMTKLFKKEKRKRRVRVYKIECKVNFFKRICIKLELVIIQTVKLKCTFASSLKNKFVK